MTEKFFRAIDDGDLATVRLIMSDDPSCAALVDSRKEFRGESALMVAVAQSQWSVARHILGAGADVNYMPDPAVVSDAYPVLHVAIIRAFTEEDEEGYLLVHELVQAGARLSIADCDGNAAMNVACTLLTRLSPRQVESRRPRIRELFESLLRAGADPNVAGDGYEAPVDQFSHLPEALALMRIGPA